QEMLIPKNLILQKYYSADVIICANKELITRFVSILLDNAVKYSPCDSIIQIELYKNDKTINLVVANKCDSLPDCPPEKLFDRFYRGDSARTQKGGGYGIGLSAAHSIAEIHGGSIKASYGNDNTIIFTVEFKI
ncbi:MAG: ATP-binding protein, partial [Candidatus Limousia pullorum]